jgi:hypothetical protein
MVTCRDICFQFIRKNPMAFPAVTFTLGALTDCVQPGKKRTAAVAVKHRYKTKACSDAIRKMTRNGPRTTSGPRMALLDMLSFFSRLSRKKADMLGQLAAINKALAVIEFRLDGTIIKANQNFLI